jgi:hypothetical protein
MPNDCLHTNSRLHLRCGSVPARQIIPPHSSWNQSTGEMEQCTPLSFFFLHIYFVLYLNVFGILTGMLNELSLKTFKHLNSTVHMYAIQSQAHACLQENVAILGDNTGSLFKHSARRHSVHKVANYLSSRWCESLPLNRTG